MGKITTTSLASAIGVTYVRINQMIKSGEIKAEKLGRDYLIDEKYIQILKDRPERRGRKTKKKPIRNGAVTA